MNAQNQHEVSEGQKMNKKNMSRKQEKPGF